MGDVIVTDAKTLPAASDNEILVVEPYSGIPTPNNRLVNGIYYSFKKIWYNFSKYLVPNNRTITINGDTKDLSRNRSWTVETGAIDSVADTNTVDLNIDINKELTADIRYQNTSTVNLSDDASGLKADFASMNISQFTNDSNYAVEIDPTTHITIFDDFVGYSGNIGISGTAGTSITSMHSVVKGAAGTYSKTTDTNHIGILTYTSSSNTTINNYIYMNSWNLGNGEFTMEFMFRIPALAGAKDYIMPMGLVDAFTNAAITNGVYFLYNRSAYGADIQCVCISGGLTNLQSSAVNITAATWHKYKIVVNAAGTEAKFYINGTLVQTMATYIPTNVLLYSFFGQQITSSSFNICGFDVDYIDYSLTLTTPR